MHKVLFVGPTLPYHEINKINQLELKTPLKKLDNIDHLDKALDTAEDHLFVLPPVSGGDLYHLNNRTNFSIGIIDGYFENQIAIWHKEILYLLSRNIHIYGSSSMGALRAAELSDFGMVGIGKIYKNFLSGLYEDDDEVTVSHGPADLGYPQISEAMANIRYTAAYALSNKILDPKTHDVFTAVAKATFYKYRNYGAIIRKCIQDYALEEKDFSRFHLWLQKYRIDQKKLDALELIYVLSGHKGTDSKWSRSFTPPKFEFHDTVIWRESITA